MTDAWRAELDQTAAAMRDMAGLLHGYYDNLVKEGFGRREALAIVMGWQDFYLSGGRNEPPPDVEP